MKKYLLTVFAFGLFLSLPAGDLLAAPKDVKTGIKPDLGKCVVMTNDEFALRQDMRKLWEDHTAWTRDYIVSAVNGLDSRDEVAARLQENQKQIGDAIKPYYGDTAGNKLAELLKERIDITVNLITATKADDKDKVAALDKSWRANGDQIAAFLAKANPNWPEPKVKEMMDKNLSLLKAQVDGTLKKDFADAIEATDSGKKHLLTFADFLSDGIVKHFPDKFKGCRTS